MAKRAVRYSMNYAKSCQSWLRRHDERAVLTSGELRLVVRSYLLKQPVHLTGQLLALERRLRTEGVIQD